MTTPGSQVLQVLLITLCPLRYCSHDYLFKVEAQQRRAPIKVEMIAFVRFSPSRYIFSGKCYFALCVFFGLLDMILISTFVPMHLFHHHHHHQLLLHHKQHHYNTTTIVISFSRQATVHYIYEREEDERTHPNPQAKKIFVMFDFPMLLQVSFSS